MKKKDLPLAKVYRLVQSGPTILLSTAHRDQRNVMPLSWHMMVEFEPPRIAVILSEEHYSFELLRKSKECVINIPTVELAEKVVRCGNMSGRDQDKFEALGLTPMPAEMVNAPLIDECYAHLECQVVDTRMVNKYNLFILEVIKARVGPKRKSAKTIHHLGGGQFLIGGNTVKIALKKK